jgi:CRISP-associated protein Cas1
MKKSLFVYNEGTLQRHDNTIRFIDKAGNKKDIPIETVGEINIMTQMEFNTSFLNILSQNGIIVHCYNYYDYYIGSFYPKESLISGELLVNQVNHYTDSDKRLKIAQKFIDGAADNIYRNVRYYNARGKDLQSTLDDIDNIRKNIYKSKSVTELMGYEGNIRKILEKFYI